MIYSRRALGVIAKRNIFKADQFVLWTNYHVKVDMEVLKIMVTQNFREFQI